jgi:fumarate hydratase, class II
VATGATLRGVAVTLMKIANDIGWLASGPRAGIAELRLPANEPASSIMPGKVNPTQSEAMVMVCIHVIADDNGVAFAGSQGNFQLYAMRPIVINNFVHSARILGDASSAMTRRRPSPTTPTALDSGAISAEDFDRIVNPANMVGPF